MHAEQKATQEVVLYREELLKEAQISITAEVSEARDSVFQLRQELTNQEASVTAHFQRALAEQQQVLVSRLQSVELANDQLRSSHLSE